METIRRKAPENARLGASERPARRGRRLGRFGYAVLGAAFVLAWLARFVPPEHLWWLQLLGPLTPLLALALAAATVFVFRRGGRGAKLFHSALLVLIVWRFGPDAPRLVRPHEDVRGGAATSDTLVVMTFNAGWLHAEKHKPMVAWLREVRPHVVGIQEATVHFVGGPNFSIGVFPFLESGLYQMPEKDPESKIVLSRPILTRVPGDVVSEFDLLDAGGTNLSNVGRARLRWQGREVVVYNVHLHSYLSRGEATDRRGGVLRWMKRVYEALRGDVRTRAREARALRRLLDAETLPFLLIGDLNTTPHNWVYRHLSEGLRDAYRSAGRSTLGTYPARLPLARIDFILASPHWVVVEAGAGPPFVSDHRPLVAALTLRTEEP
ncbi:endonuclease/exonuclease/phosphatase family protein [Rhodocaloribacter sp.]